MNNLFLSFVFYIFNTDNQYIISVFIDHKVGVNDLLQVIPESLLTSVRL